jgi:RNA polymerase I-specific transcription initiation factor RRN7
VTMFVEMLSNSFLLIASNPFAEMFPSGRMGVESRSEDPGPVTNDNDAIESKLEMMMSQIKSMRIISEEEAAGLDHDLLRPGASYPFYRSVSILPDTARPFYEAAARLVGLSLHVVTRVVLQTEFRLQRWQEDERRAEYHGESLQQETQPVNLSQMGASDRDSL